MIEELKLPKSDNPDNVLDGAKGHLNKVIIIGEDHNGNLYFASSFSYKPLLLWFSVEFVKELLNDRPF